MVKKKPAALPPDTGPPAGAPPPGVLQDASEHNSAERTESFDSNAPEIRRTKVPIIAARLHHVLFTVAQDGNAIRFLSDLLINLQVVDATAKILAHKDAPSEYVPLGRISEIPTEATAAKNFAKAYLIGLKVTSQGDMKGRVTLQTQAQFKNLKRNIRFRTWLDGSTVAPLRPRIQLDRTELSGSKRVSAGFFFNVVARHDMATNFQAQIIKSLSTSIGDTGPIPEFEIEAYSAHSAVGRVRLYRALTASIADVYLLTEKLAVIMPTPKEADICFIPQKVWNTLLGPKKTEYYTMQQTFALAHNAIRFVGLKNASLYIPGHTATGQYTAKASAMSIFTWLTKVKSSDNCNLFPKVFPCENGDIELWHHVSHDKEARAWMSTALAEIARESSIDLEHNRLAAEAMFKNPDKVWQGLAKLRRGVSLPEQRSVYMDFRPPTGVVIFPSREKLRYPNKRKGLSKVRLTFDVNTLSTQSASTMSVMTTEEQQSFDETRRERRERYKAERKTRTVATPATGITTAATTEATSFNQDKVAAQVAAKNAVEVANAAIRRHPPKVRLAHTGDYVTIADAYGNQLPVVRIANAWVPLTEASLLESRTKSPAPNFGVATSYPSTATRQSGGAERTPRPTSTQATNTISAVKMDDERKPAAVVRNSGSKNNAEPILQRIEDAPGATPMDLGVHEAHLELSEDATMFDAIDGDEDEDDSTIGGLVESLWTNESYASISTSGQSVVTWAQVASHHTFDPMLGAADTATHSDSEEVERQFPTRSSLTKLESTRSKDRRAASQLSSLQVALKNEATNQQELAATRAPIFPPQIDDQGRMIFAEEDGVSARYDADGIMSAPTDGPKSRYAVRILRKRMVKMKEDNENLTAMVQQLTLAVSQLQKNQSQLVVATPQPQVSNRAPYGLPFPQEHIEQVSTEIVEWSPSRHRRRSKKTVLQSTERSPPREPSGTPQVAKKKRVSASPIANRYGALASDTSDAEMDEKIEFGDVDEKEEAELANKVGERVNNLRVYNTFLGPDSSTETGAGLQK